MMSTAQMQHLSSGLDSINSIKHAMSIRPNDANDAEMQRGGADIGE